MRDDLKAARKNANLIPEIKLRAATPP